LLCRAAPLITSPPQYGAGSNQAGARCGKQDAVAWLQVAALKSIG
jgi:hypothetical protein